MALNIKQIEKQFRFVDTVPQPLYGRNRKYNGIYQRLMKRPGQPALVGISKNGNSLTSLATSLRSYGVKVYTRTLITGELAVYAVYNKKQNKAKAHTRPATKRTTRKQKRR